MKTFVIMVSRTFPQTHIKAGELTCFAGLILTALMGFEKGHGLKEKKHTIRKNYDFWENRIAQIQKGEAVLSLRSWIGKPYRSKQVEICKIDSTSGVGIQKLNNPSNFVFASIDGKQIDWQDVAKNDGLAFEDFCDWFKHRQNSPMAIIHFTNFRY